MDSKTDSIAAWECGRITALKFRVPCCLFMLSILLSKARFRHTITQRAEWRSSRKTTRPLVLEPAGLRALSGCALYQIFLLQFSCVFPQFLGALVVGQEACDHIFDGYR